MVYMTPEIETSLVKSKVARELLRNARIQLEAKEIEFWSVEIEQCLFAAR